MSIPISQRPVTAQTNGSSFLHDVLHGLSQPQKEVPCKYFYDKRGSELFDRICELEAYYPTRTELQILESSVAEMAARAGSNRLVIEFGSGSSIKTRLLLDHLDAPSAYVPIDISGVHLESSAAALQDEYPNVDILPLCADYTAPFELPEGASPDAPPLIYFPGSTIGNFSPAQAVDFLKRTAEIAGPEGSALIGVDLKKDPEILERAYNDEEGVTAAFNRNIVRRMQNELGADASPEDFEHRAIYNEREGRVEMHLVSKASLDVRIGEEHSFHFDTGETIRTECSYKYELSEFAALASEADLAVDHVWTDPRNWFSVQYLVTQ